MSSSIRFALALVTATLAGCTVGTGAPATKADGAGGAPSKGAPAALVGTWTAGRGGTTVAYDTLTSTSSPSNASGLAFQFAADGTFAKAYRDSNGGSCPMIVLATESGTVEWGDGDFVLHSERGTSRMWSSCGGPVATQPLGDGELDRARYTFAFDGEDLVLTRATDKATARFRRAQ